MFFLKKYQPARILEKISDLIFQKLSLFFSGEKYPVMVRISDIQVSGEATSHAIAEWSLHQDYSDIFVQDISAILEKITPPFVRRVERRIRWYFQVLMAEDEIFELSCNIKYDQLFGTDYFNKMFNYYLSARAPFVAARKCCFNFILYLKKPSSAVVLSFNRKTGSLNEIDHHKIKVSLILRHCRYHLCKIRGPGFFKLIPKFLLHKRI